MQLTELINREWYNLPFRLVDSEFVGLDLGEFQGLFEKLSSAYAKQILKLEVTKQGEFKFANCLGYILQYCAKVEILLI